MIRRVGRPWHREDVAAPSLAVPSSRNWTGIGSIWNREKFPLSAVGLDDF